MNPEASDILQSMISLRSTKLCGTRVRRNEVALFTAAGHKKLYLIIIPVPLYKSMHPIFN